MLHTLLILVTHGLDLLTVDEELWATIAA